jgi:hypothetical protein
MQYFGNCPPFLSLFLLDWFFKHVFTSGKLPLKLLYKIFYHKFLLQCNKFWGFLFLQNWKKWGLVANWHLSIAIKWLTTLKYFVSSSFVITVLSLITSMQFINPKVYNFLGVGGRNYAQCELEWVLLQTYPWVFITESGWVNVSYKLVFWVHFHVVGIY